MTRFLDRFPKTLWLILAVALALRLLGAWRANLVFDERAHLALAETIDLRPAHFHLVSRTLDHPLLSIYVLKLGGLLFGTSDFGLRILYVLAGTATLLPVYFLGRRAFSENAGLWAAGLLAVDQFHASWSRVFMPEVWMLLFAALALLQFLRTLEKESTKSYVLLGLLLGLAYLGKEPGILLVPLFWVYLLITPPFRRILLRPGWYLAHAVFAVVIAPDLIWNLTQLTESYLYRAAAFAAEPWQLSLKSFSLYLGELLQVLLGRDVLDPGYAQGNLYVCHWIAGLLYLIAVVAATRRRDSTEVRLMLVAFWFVFGTFLIAPGGERFDPFWWASISLIPAVVCAGGLLDRLIETAARLLAQGTPRAAKDASDKQTRPILVPSLVALLLLGYLGARCSAVARRPGPCVPRATVDDFVDSFLQEGHKALEGGRLVEARRRFIYVLNIGGRNADAYFGLAAIAQRLGHPGKAAALRAKGRKLDSHR